MSGGIHNYLHARAPGELGTLADEVYAMGESIKAMGYPVCAARAKRLADAIHAARIEAAAMADLFHDVEWFDSCDWGKGPARAEAVKLGEPLPPCQHPTTHKAYGFPGGEGPNARVNGEFDDCDECGEALNFVPRDPLPTDWAKGETNKP